MIMTICQWLAATGRLREDQQVRIILDTDLSMGDPGSEIDDGFALALCVAEPALDLERVTTVHGNTDVLTATRLAIDLLDRLGRPEIDVHQGAMSPLLRPRHRAVDQSLLSTRHGEPTPAAVALIEQVRAAPGEITVVAVGPLTNVALAIKLDPSFAQHLGGLVIMGGRFSSSTGSTRMPGEFNIWCDPEAAAIVLDSGIVASWVGLDVTEQVRLSRDQATTMAASPQRFVSFAGQYTLAWLDHLQADSCALHDPLAVAALVRPDLLTWNEAYVQVEIGDRLRGMMLADRTASSNARIAQTVDAAGFAEWFSESLAHAAG